MKQGRDFDNDGSACGSVREILSARLTTRWTWSHPWLACREDIFSFEKITDFSMMA